MREKPFLAILALLLLSVAVSAQEIDSNLDSLMRMSAFTEESELQKVLNKNLTVSSAKALTTRETPGIISLVTAEEIQNSGARDLVDILRLIPGFDVLQDLQFVMGIGLRGNWANEGKVLLLLDGQQFNDLLYQGVAIGNHFSVDAIERIEIIRGPGSAMYGGSAEYGVINIITKAAQSLDGILVYGTAGFHRNDVGRTNGGVSVAQKGDKFSWDVSLFKGKSIISDGAYEELYGDTIINNLATATAADPMNISLGFKAGGLQFRGMYDDFQITEPYTFISFKNYFADLKYDWKLSSKVSITPELKYINQIPWQYGYLESFEGDDGEVVEAGDYLKVRSERMLASLGLNYDISRKVNLNFGALYFQDRATDLLEENYYFGKNTFSLNNVAVFAQGLLKHRLVNATLGIRYERNSQYGDAFVPRMALTKKIENFHFKILGSQAFRAPAIENINLASNADGTIRPEKSNVFEVEVGYQFTPEMLLAVNAFSIKTKDIIVYGADDSTDGTYKNYPESGSNGVEVVYSIRKKNWYTNISYSYSQALVTDDVVQTYIVPQSSSQYVGFPLHKITMNNNITLTENLSFNTSIVMGSKRYAFNESTTDVDGDGLDDLDEDGEVIYSTVANDIGRYFLINTFLNYKNIYKGFNVGAGVYDLLNDRPQIPQAYDGGYAPAPGRSREFVLKLSYQLNFNK